jgi:hypothetical protein
MMWLSAIAPTYVAAQENPEKQVLSAEVETQDDDRVVEMATKMEEPERRDLSFVLPKGQPIDVDNPYGSVFLRFGGYEHKLDIRTTTQQPKGTPTFSFSSTAKAGRFVVAAALPGGGARAEGQRIDLVLYVPENHAVNVRTTDGGIESRGLKGDLIFKSDSGNINARGTEGSVQAETGEGRIRIMLGPAPAGSTQRFATRTGDIVIGATDGLDADVRMSTSGTLTTDYSVAIEHRDREEPNKHARASVGAPKAGKDNAVVAIESLRGNLQLWRRAVFLEAGDDGDAD